MNNNSAFLRKEKGQNEQIHNDRQGRIPLLTQFGLKIVNPKTKEITIFPFYNQNILMDWSDYLKKMKEGQENNLHCCITGHEPLSVSILNGDASLLSTIYNYCISRYIFKKGTQFLTLKTLKEENYFSIRIVKNQNDEKTYYEKILLTESSNQHQEMSFLSNRTECEEIIIPEEIQIILDLHRVQAPHVLPVDSIFFDEIHYSYIYSKQKDTVDIIQYFQRIKEDKYCLIIHIAQQLIKCIVFTKQAVLIFLEEQEIVFPTIHHKNLHINTNTLDIFLMNYSQAYYSQNNETRRRCANFGYAPPEYFNQDQDITTKANIFQAGALLFYLLFDQTPFGKTHSDIVQNTLRNKTDLTLLKREEPSISNFIMLMLENDQNKRPTAKQLLGHRLFKPQTLLKYSKHSINQSFHLSKKLEPTQEFDQFNLISNIQLVRSKIVKVKPQGIS